MSCNDVDFAPNDVVDYVSSWIGDALAHAFHLELKIDLSFDISADSPSC